MLTRWLIGGRMPMILYACIVRLHDGLPLSASTDFHLDKQLSDCKRRLKSLSLTISQRPPRGTAKVCDFLVHFSSAVDISSLAICCAQYPSAMAFCFLDELLWEFSSSYSKTTVALASRPYAFLEFAPNYRMTPLTALGILSLTLNIMCSALSLIRGVHLAEHPFQSRGSI
ncbi:hypothetical protein GDO86_012030 [Hymenochirus boettgeri]|uniref:Longin domain-containing protein n=1 Tax=Hymenochirus boettgeri TaxID=247094 RepID=A0A8T2JLU6_9PIPI|nr:hypothetical protein GDO86_012030 [Hymenochirus boettgeri]